MNIIKDLIEKLLWLFKSGEILKYIPDHRDLHFKELLLGKYERKYPSYLLKPYFIENQYGLAVCSFEAWAVALGVYFGEPVSARWLVAKAWQQGLCKKYGYAEIRSGAKVAKKWGVVFEKDLPSDERLSWEEFVRIDFHNYDAIAEKNKIGSYYFIDTYSEYLQAIDTGYAVVLGRDWVNPVPFTSPWVIGRNGRYYGPHATCGIGYKEALLIGANSWGVKWGDKGLFYIPLGDLEKDIKDYGAIAITPIPYTPKDIKVKSLIVQLKKLKDKLMNALNASQILYATAKGLLGQNLAPQWQPLACAASLSYICNKAFQDDINFINTTQFYEWMKKSEKWEELTEIEPMSVLVYVTGQIPAGSPLKNGHIFICGKYLDTNGSYYLMSNNSNTSKWDTAYNVKTAKTYYEDYGQIKPHYFRRVII